MKRLLISSLCAALLLCAAFSLTVFAQDSATTTQPATEPWALMLYNTIGGAAISFLISALKNWSVVKSHPKWTALAVSVLATAIPMLSSAPFAAKGFGPVVVSILTQLAAAIGTHEAVTQPIKDKVNP
jgi:peptidoglycan/LPS O-acetylase OafA/YrhL